MKTGTLKLLLLSWAPAVALAGAITLSGCDFSGLFASSSRDILDRTPDDLRFSPVLNASLDSYVYSDPVSISGVNSPVTLKVIAGEVSVDGSAFTTMPQLVGPGQVIRLRARSASDFDKETRVMLDAGEVRANFVVRTQSEEYVIDAEKPLFETLPDNRWAALAVSIAGQG